MSTIAENRDSIIALSILALTVLSIGIYIYKGIIKGAEIATKGDLLEAYYEGYKDGNSGNFISQYEAWTNSSTYERLMMSGELDD